MDNSRPVSGEETVPIFLVLLSCRGSSSNCLKIENVLQIDLWLILCIWKYQISLCKFTDAFIWFIVQTCTVLTKLSFEKYRPRIRNPLLAFHPSIMANNNTVISMASGKSIKSFHIFNRLFVYLEKSIPLTNYFRCNPNVRLSRRVNGRLMNLTICKIQVIALN